MSIYYYGPENNPLGPYSAEEMRKMADEGKISDDTFVISDGQPNWVRFADWKVAQGTSGGLPPVPEWHRPQSPKFTSKFLISWIGAGLLLVAGIVVAIVLGLRSTGTGVASTPPPEGPKASSPGPVVGDGTGVRSNSFEARGQSSRSDSPQQFGDSSATAPPAKARIVFVEGDDTIGYAIFKRDLSDTNSEGTRLTHVSFSKTAPAGKPVAEKIPTISPKSRPRWSPDGQRIAFIGGGPIRWGSQDTGSHGKWATKYGELTRVEDIWVMNEDGQAVRPLVQIQVGDHGGISAFRWSPDGNKIAFTFNDHASNKRGLYVVDVNTRKIEELSRGGMGKGRWLTDEFCWSPDGKAIVGIDQSGQTADEKICIVSIDGKCADITQGGFKLHPHWWPDGKITFCRGDASYAELDSNFWIMDSDGGNQERIRKGRNIVEMPSGREDGTELSYVYPFWMSGDGRTIAFQWRVRGPNPRKRSGGDIDVVCIKNVEESSLGKTITCSLDGVYFQRGEDLPYDLYFESPKDSTTQAHPATAPTSGLASQPAKELKLDLGNKILKGKIVFIDPHYSLGEIIIDYNITIQGLDTSALKNIYAYHADKNNPHLELDKPVIDLDSNPVWTRDGNKIIFMGKRTIKTSGPNFSLIVPSNKVAVNSSDIREWMPFKHPYAYPAFYDIGQGRDLWMIDEAGNNLQQLTQFENCTGFKLSPDGKKIAFILNKNRYYTRPNPSTGTVSGSERVPPFCVMDIDTKKTTILSTAKPPFIDEQYGREYGINNKLYYAALNFSDFSWSPDSKKIAFSPYYYQVGSDLGWAGDGNIWIIDADGSNLRSITKSGPYNNHRQEDKCINIRWWPNGKITFDRYGRQWMVGSDGTDMEDISKSGDYRLGCGKTYWFSPDGSKVVFWDVIKERDTESHVRYYDALYLKEMSNFKVYLVWKQHNIATGFDLFWEE